MRYKFHTKGVFYKYIYLDQIFILNNFKQFQFQRFKAKLKLYNIWGGETLHVIISRTQQSIETTLVYQF